MIPGMGDSTAFDWLAAAHTPFDGAGGVALDVIEVQAEHLLRQGVKGVFVCGTTGEGLSLSVDERKQVAARWEEVRRGTDLSLWVHVGANALPEVRELARDAAEVGADAIALMPPCFFRPEDEEHLASWCASVSEASGGMPMTLYEAPEMTGVRLDVERFIELARVSVPGYRGLKYTDSNLTLFARLCDGLEEGEGMWWGRDEELQAGIAAGATGAIGSSYNFAGKVYEPVLATVEGGASETAAAAQARAVSLIEVIASYGYLGAAKAVMEMLGVPLGPTRAPLGNPEPLERKRLQAELEELGFFDWVAG